MGDQVSDASIVSHLASLEVPGGESWHNAGGAAAAALSAANITASEKRVKRLKAAAPPPRRPLRRRHLLPRRTAVAAAPRAAASASIVLIAGSQTGADRASLEAARAAGIATAGVAPQGWKTERGTEQAVLEALGLQEGSGGYAAADKANVKQCDAVLAFRFRVPKTGRGAEKTVHCARTAGTYEHVELAWPPAGVVSEALEPLAPGGRPVLVVWDLQRAERAARRRPRRLVRRFDKTADGRGPPRRHLGAKRLMVTGRSAPRRRVGRPPASRSGRCWRWRSRR